MSKNVEKKKITIKGEKSGKRSQYKSPINKDKEIESENKNQLDNPNKEMKFLESSTNNFIYDITQEKDNNLDQSGKSSYLSKLNNNIHNFSISDNPYLFPLNNRDISLLTESNIDNNSTNSNTIASNKQNKISKNLPNTGGNKNNVLDKKILNDNAYENDPYDSKYSIKINKIKDDYIDFLQKEFEDNTKKSVKLDSNNKELLKKCDDLMHDNRVLSNTLNERTAKLNKIIQENLMIKSQLDKSLLNIQKNEQKLEFYEEQFNLFKSSNDNYQKIIKELKEQNNQLNLNLEEIEKTNEENLKNQEENFQIQLKEEIENAKKEMEEIYDNRNLEENEKIEKKAKSYLERIKELEEKTEKLENDLSNKDNMFDLVCKENEKLTSENNLFRTQVDQYSHQINELNTIIKHKDSIINNLKTEFINSEKLLNKSNSYSMMKFDGNEFINENITKLITDNEENKMKIELLNDKIKSIDEMERKYNEIMNGSNTLTLSEKLAYRLNNINSPKNVQTHFNYNNINEIKNTPIQKNTTNKYINTNNFKSFISPTKLDLSKEYNMINSPDYSFPEKEFRQENRNNGHNVVVFSSYITKDKKKKNNNNFNINIENKPKNRINIDREIKVTKKGNKVPDKVINKPKIVEIKTTPIKGNYKKVEENKIKQPIERKNLISHGKELEEENDEVKVSIREMNRKKNYTYKPKKFNITLDELEYGQKNVDKIFGLGDIEEEVKSEHTNLYLYGIDRNDILHTFDINNKKWCDMRKISDLNDKSDTFKKDYQYEGTLLYNTLYGVYILTGEKTDTLYYLNSQTNSITKICKFDNCHDNGSIMYDTDIDCLYVFGGKKIRSCEYYSFREKKVYKLPDLITDRANASFIVSNNKIYGFFGFCYSKNNYAKNIEYMDYYKKDTWLELKNIEILSSGISFDTESVSTMYYMHNPNKILIYCGIQGDDEDFVTEYYLLYDVKNNSMEKINKWNMQQYKNIGKKWKNYNFKKNDPKGFHFAKNTRFLILPKDNNYEGYNERDNIDIMIDYKNNIHYILQEKQKIDIYRSDS